MTRIRVVEVGVPGPPGPGGGSDDPGGGVPAGYLPVVTEDVPDPVAASVGDTSTFRCFVVGAADEFKTVFGIKRADDDFPWLLFSSDGTVIQGDGTFDAFASGVYWKEADGSFEIEAATGDIQIQADDGDVTITAGSGVVDVFGRTYTVHGDIVVSLPVEDPGAVGQLWNDNGTVKVSAGPP